MLRYSTAGESHGPALVALVDGFPAGLAVDPAVIDHELKRRQGGYGRGGRQRIETDTVTFLSGLWRGITLGSPLALEVINKDAKIERLEDVDRPRPGYRTTAELLPQASRPTVRVVRAPEAWTQWSSLPHSR